MTNKKKKLLLVLILVAAALFIIPLFITLGARSGKTPVTVEVQPADSTLTLDGKTIKAGKVYLTPGKHIFKASRPLFGDVSKTINTADINESNSTIYLLPDASSASAQKFLRDHEDVQLERERIGSAKADLEGEARAKEYPILSELPYESIDFKVDYGFNSDGSLKLVVTLFPFSQPDDPEQADDYKTEVETFKEEANDFLTKNGVDIEKTDITYKNS